MTLQNTDLFYVQRGATGHKIEYGNIGFLPETGGNLTGAVTANEITIEAGSWDLSEGNFFNCGAITVPTPTNGVNGQSGLIRFTAAPTSLPTELITPTGFNITAACIVPFYVRAEDEILLGNPVEVS